MLWMSLQDKTWENNLQYLLFFFISLHDIFIQIFCSVGGIEKSSVVLEDNGCVI